MKIKETGLHVRTLLLKDPYSICYESVDRCEIIFLKVETDNGLVGWGCATPVQKVTGETAGETVRLYQEEVESFLKGREISEYAGILEYLGKKLSGKPSIRAMVDMALYDLLARKAGVPLYRFLGGHRDSIPTSITVGIMPVEAALSCAKEFLDKGFRIIKLKGGRNVDEDIEKIRKLREMAGPATGIRFDANQGYSLPDVMKFIRETENIEIEFLEQPTPADNFELLKQVTRQSTIPIMADESLLSAEDALEISRNKCADMVNIKLMKTGGILEAMEVNSIVKAAGIQVMVGCMDESALGIAAGLHFALASPNVRFADLDGHLDLLEDPFEGMLRIEEGNLISSTAPGLGWNGYNKLGL
jgi:L-Ala-D/L-Glu epimerase